MMSERSLGLLIPEKAIAFPGANLEGLANHLSSIPSVHLRVALADRADEYAKPSDAAIFSPGSPPSAGPTE